MSENNWDTIKVSDLVTVLTDYVSNGSFASLAENVEYQQSGYARLIRLVDYNKGFVEKDSVWVSEDAYNFLAKSKLFGDEIIISNVGEYAGKAFICPNLGYPMSLAPNSIMMKTSGNDRFYYYYFCSPKGYKQIRNIVTKSGQPKFNKTNFRELEVPNPPIEVQDAIVKVLKTIDDKIDNNNAICSNLEAMAKLLYDYWFVQFDFPDENGNPYKSSGGKMVWNDELKREIPAGWEVKCVSDIGTLEQNSIWPNDDMVYSHYSIPAFDDSHMPILEEGSAIESNKYLIPENCVLISKLNPQFKRIWLIINPLENAICSTEFLPIRAGNIGINYLYEVVNSDAFSVHLSQKASSSTGSRKRIDPENCMAFQFASDDRIAKLYNLKIASLIEQANQIPMENQSLVSLRDFLLPMLMNGQVKVGA